MTTTDYACVQEEHSAFVVRCWRGYLSGVRCKWLY